MVFQGMFLEEMDEKADVEIEEQAKVLMKVFEVENVKEEAGFEHIAHGTQVRHLDAEPPSPMRVICQCGETDKNKRIVRK